MLFKVRALALALPSAVACMVAALTLSAAPAAAEFQSNSTKATGLGHSGAVVLEGGGATLECASTQGTWTILNGAQEVTKGPQLKLNITTWNGCTAKSSFAKGVSANVKACILDFEQATKEKAKGSTVTECTIEVKVLGTCIISVPAQQKNLEKNEMKNAGSNLEIIAEDAGITTEPKGSCLGIEKTTNAKEKFTFAVGGGKTEPVPGFLTESGWSLEGKQNVIKLSSTARATCEKAIYKGVTPVSGFSPTIATTPSYGGCQIEIKKGGTPKTTPATLEAGGCTYQVGGSEAPGKEKFKAESELVGCSGGESGGLKLKDKELEAGKTCEIVILEQSLGRSLEGKTIKEATPLEAEGKLNAGNVSAKAKECPAEIDPNEKEFPFIVIAIVAIVVLLACAGTAM